MTSLLGWVTTFNHNRENAQEISHFCCLHSENDIFVVTNLQSLKF